MSLMPSEQRRLTEIEHQLSRSDPKLAAMFAVLTDEAMKRRSVRRWLRAIRRRVQRCWPRPANPARLFILTAVTVTLLVASVAMALVAASHAAPSRRGHGSCQCAGSGLP